MIVPAISWATTYYPLHQYGLKLKFVDVDLETLNINSDLLETALTLKTKMVVVFNILDNPYALQPLKLSAKKHNLILFEDNCESMGAMLNNRYCERLGMLEPLTLSFLTIFQQWKVESL